MPRFRFTAVDSTGTVHDGTIDAANETAARNKLASNGLAVRTVEEAGTAPNTPADADEPRQPTTRAATPTVPRRAVAFAEQPAPLRRRSSSLPLVLSLIALVLAVATAAYVFYRDPPGGKLSRYDFRTPEAALTSHARMLANGDSAALSEYTHRLTRKDRRERFETLKITRTADYTEGRKALKVLFIEYEHEKVKQQDVIWYEKDEELGMWLPRMGAPPDLHMRNPQLAAEIRRWSKTDNFEQFPGMMPGGIVPPVAVPPFFPGVPPDEPPDK